MAAYLKDEKLNEIASKYNVAQFVSFSPGSELSLRHHRISETTGEYPNAESAVAALLERSPTVNVRAFRSDVTKGAPFAYGLGRIGDVLSKVTALASDGYYTIVNETIDIHDGGVSGVSLGGIVEFAPDDTPRGVELAGTFSAPAEMANDILRAVYGFHPKIPSLDHTRVEFSVHPNRVGFWGANTVVWEVEHVPQVELPPRLTWPNRFSRLVGDKAFGLLIASACGLPVPLTTVIGRRVAPFSFGRDTGSTERWLRTCPAEQVPGKFTTLFGYSDPFELMQREDPEGSAIASIISQQAVDSIYSGASLPVSGNEDTVQGVRGRGDQFMQGSVAPDLLPVEIVSEVRSMAASVRELLGPVRLEWAHDGHALWVLQMHIARDFRGVDGTLNPGTPRGWFRFDPSDGLDVLRRLTSNAGERGYGIEVTAAVGITSHVGDIIRKAGIPGRIMA